jgi:hypothetical protein
MQEEFTEYLGARLKTQASSLKREIQHLKKKKTNQKTSGISPGTSDL